MYLQNILKIQNEARKEERGNRISWVSENKQQSEYPSTLQIVTLKECELETPAKRQKL